MSTKELVQDKDDQQQAVMSALDKMYWDLHMAFFTQSRDFLGAKFDGKLGFVGTSERVDFLSMSHLRYLAEAKESEVAEISYYLQPSEEDPSRQVLMRRESTQIDRDFSEGGKSYEILDSVDRIEFRYLPFGEDKEYKSQWDTDSLDYAGRLPWAVELKLYVFFPQEEEPRFFTMLVPIKFQLPLKKKKKL